MTTATTMTMTIITVDSHLLEVATDSGHHCYRCNYGHTPVSTHLPLVKNKFLRNDDNDLQLHWYGAVS